jgi:prevent-host-death family protein
MAVFNIHDAKTQFSKLVDAAAKGEEVIIAKAGVPTARLVPFAQPKPIRRFGTMKGKIWIADDFDAPMPDDVLADFEGR